MDKAPYPVTVTANLSIPPGRWLWIFKWLLSIPSYIILCFLSIAAMFVTIYAFFSILFTGKYPESLFNFNVGVMRWSWRLDFYSYNALGTDKYPPFSLDEGGYPANLNVKYPARLSRGLVLIKWWLLAIPHYIIVSIFVGGKGNGLTGILSIISGFFLLFTGKYPEDLFKLIVGMNRWAYRVYAYAALMTDEYPPFSFDP